MIHTINLNESNKYLCMSIKKVIPNCVISGNYSVVSFKAQMVRTFVPGSASYSFSLLLIYSIGLQLREMITKYKVVPITIDPENILIINGSIFIFTCKARHLYRIDEREHITFLSPFYTNNLSAPELLSCKELPLSINYRFIYYTLGILAISALGCDIKSVKGTKLYYTIMRCINPDIDNRCLLFI